MRFERSVFLTAALFLTMSLAAQAGILFQENWNAGTIDTTKWLVLEGSGNHVQLENLGGGDYAIYTSAGDTHNASQDHKNVFYSTAIYPRGGNLRCTFKAWGDPNKTNWAGPFPANSCVGGPWKYEQNALAYAATEAGVSGWDSLPYKFDQHTWNGPTAMSDNFKNTFDAAVSKVTAVTIRVTLGDTQGAKCEWSTDGVNWNQEVNTIGSSGGTAPAYLGWGTYVGAVFIDDILVENDTGVTPSPTPTPPPTPSPTAAPTLTPLPAGVLPFVEDWHSNSIDTNKWITWDGNGINHVAIEEIGVGSGDFSIYTAAGDTADATWENYFYSVQAFPRGKNLRCTFKFWGDPSKDSWAGKFPANACINGPWHLGNTVAGNGTQQDIEAGINCWPDLLTYNENAQWINQPPGLNLETTPFKDKYKAAVSKNLALTIRVWLGNHDGSKGEYSDNGGQTWTLIRDTRDTGANGNGTANPVYLGFGSYIGAVFIDDIVVEDDDHVLAVATATPTATPTATATAQPTATIGGKATGISQSWYLYD